MHEWCNNVCSMTHLYRTSSSTPAEKNIFMNYRRECCQTASDAENVSIWWRHHVISDHDDIMTWNRLNCDIFGVSRKKL